jgi:probable F420-dependent oxidoreductase
VSFKLGIGLFTGQLPPGTDRSFHREYRDSMELVRLVEEVGLDGAWVSEHHFAADGYLPSLLPLMAAYAAITERIELGTGVVLAPFHDPIRLAEDFAVVDQISGGRVVCGLGVGWRDEEFRQFNIDIRSRVGRLRELVEVLRLAWTRDRFDFAGKHFDYSGVAVTPRPARVPPILIGGMVDNAIRRAGRIGDGYISSRTTLERAGEAFSLAAEARAEAGAQGPPMVALLHNAFVTNDPDRDWPMVRVGIGHQLGTYAGWRAGTDVPGTPLKVMPPDDNSIRSSTAFGTPEQVIDRLAPFADLLGDYPDGRLICRFHYPGMDAEPAADAIRLFAREVAPELRRRAAR